MTDSLDPLPPAAKLVYKILEYNGPLTHGEIVHETRLPRGTVSDALSRLNEIDLIQLSRGTEDARKHIYDLKDTK